MKKKILRNLFFGTCLVLGTVGIPVQRLEYRVTDGSEFPKIKYIYDRDHDGEADKTLSFYYGSRFPIIDYKEATEKEKIFFTERKKF